MNSSGIDGFIINLLTLLKTIVIQDHHGIPQVLLNGGSKHKPHPLLVHAKSMGIDIRTASWNIEPVVNHSGGHIDTYTDKVAKALDGLSNLLRKKGQYNDPKAVEGSLANVAKVIFSKIDNGTWRLYNTKDVRLAK